MLPPQFSPKSKLYAVKPIQFLEETVKRGIKLVKIEAVEEHGDMFTKTLPRVTFVYLRYKIVGLLPLSENI